MIIFVVATATAAFSKAPGDSSEKKEPVKEDITDFNDWHLSCIKVGKSDKKQCRLFQKVLGEKDKHPAVTAIFAISKGKEFFDIYVTIG